MPVGLQIFDSAGNIVLDITDTVPKYLGSVSISASDGINTQTGTVTNSSFSLGQLWWLTTLSPGTDYDSDVRVSLSGTTLTWVAGANCPGCFLYYGII